MDSQHSNSPFFTKAENQHIDLQRYYHDPLVSYPMSPLYDYSNVFDFEFNGVFYGGGGSSSMHFPELINTQQEELDYFCSFPSSLDVESSSSIHDNKMTVTMMMSPAADHHQYCCFQNSQYHESCRDQYDDHHHHHHQYGNAMTTKTTTTTTTFFKDFEEGQRGSAETQNSKRVNKARSSRRRVLQLEEIQKHFGIPITRAAKEMKVGLTVLKKRCRELNIMRWPHRKIKSLKSLINNVKDMGMGEEVAVLEAHKRMLEEVPQMELTERTKRLRQACFKANYKKRKSSSPPLASQ